MSQYPDGFERAQARYEAMEDQRYYPPWACARCDEDITHDDDICDCGKGATHHERHHEDDQEEECPACHGSGIYGSPNNPVGTKPYNCPQCDGEGVVPKK